MSKTEDQLETLEAEYKMYLALQPQGKLPLSFNEWVKNYKDHD